MDYFKKNGFDVEKDIIDTKVQENAPLEELFLAPIFLDELNYQNELLIEYIKKKENIHKLIWYIRILGIPNVQSENRCFNFPYFSYEVLSACNDEISEALIDDDEEMNNLFGLACEYNNDIYDTSYGYMQGAIQNMISQNNSHNKTFIEKIRKNAGHYVYPYVAVMNKSSAEYLFDIVGHQEEGFGGFKEQLFRHLLESFLDYASKFPKFKSIFEEIDFWRKTFAKLGVEGKRIILSAFVSERATGIDRG